MNKLLKRYSHYISLLIIVFYPQISLSVIIDEPELKEIFKSVKFNPQPERIEFRDSLAVRGGDLEVHFRDGGHLRQVIESIPLIEAKRIFYILNPEVEDGREFVPVNGQLEQKKFINILASQPIALTGKVKSLPYFMILPQGSKFDFPGCEYRCEGIQTGLHSYQRTLSLIETINRFDANLLKIRTADAETLLKNREANRKEYPSHYPHLDELSDLYAVTNLNINIEPIDSLDSSSPIIYVSNTKEQVRQMRKRLPAFGKDYLSFVSPRHGDGVYSVDPFYLSRGFKISSDGELLLSGAVVLPEYNILIKAKGSVWIIGMKVKGNGIIVKSKARAAILNYHPSMECPPGLMFGLWNLFCKYKGHNEAACSSDEE